MNKKLVLEQRVRDSNIARKPSLIWRMSQAELDTRTKYLIYTQCVPIWFNEMGTHLVPTGAAAKSKFTKKLNSPV